jgi:hypothetical protein
MFEENQESGSFNDLFADDAPVEETQEEIQEETQESDVPEQSEYSEEHQQEETETQQESPQHVAIVEVDGQEFKLSEHQIQTMTEKYVTTVQENKELLKTKEKVQEALGYIENIREGQNIDEAMHALGVDFNALIREKVKEFIRRSTLSDKEREFEDMQKDREKLKSQLDERQRKDQEESEKARGTEQAQTIISTVNSSLSSVPEHMRKEIQIEIFAHLEKRIRNGGTIPSAKAVQNAVTTIYNRKKQTTGENSKENVTKKVTTAPKPVKNNPTPSTQVKKSSYNATDYNNLF